MPDLRIELLTMKDADQAARGRWLQSKRQDDDAAQEMTRIDVRNTARMKQIIAASGWPTRTRVGKDSANAAGLLAQHADADPAFQMQCLALMEPLVATGEASGVDFAYLTDRVLRAGTNRNATTRK